MIKVFRGNFPLASSAKKREKPATLSALEKPLKHLIKTKFASHLKLYVLDSGSCNACALELQLLFSPLYKLSSLGIEVVYDSKKADILLVTGLMTENMYPEAKRVFADLAAPKRVLSIGDCPLMMGVFKDTFALNTKNDILYSVDNIAGCPPSPTLLLDGLYDYLKRK